MPKSRSTRTPKAHQLDGLSIILGIVIGIVVYVLATGPLHLIAPFV